MIFDTSKVTIDELHEDLFIQKQVKLYVLRLDKIHPLVSGNKIFKLHYFLQEALQSAHKTILSFGGAYSNHLAATAFACKTMQLKSIGMVRGEKPRKLSATLEQCLADGMQLQFMSRSDYNKKEEPGFMKDLETSYGPCTIVPEGGYHPLGAKGAAKIMELIKIKDFTHICMASGTATTLAGLISAARPAQTVISIPVLKGITDTAERLKFLIQMSELPQNVEILSEYHFGGYAKKNEQLIDFMDHCLLMHHLPLDFVYTAKMFYGVYDCIKNNYFKKGSEVICLHTGGLQGNKSLTLNQDLI